MRSRLEKLKSKWTDVEAERDEKTEKGNWRGPGNQRQRREG